MKSLMPVHQGMETRKRIKATTNYNYIEFKTTARRLRMIQEQSTPLKENNLNTPKENILIIEDSSDSLHSLAQILSNLGYKIYLALGDEMALQIANVSPPDLILLDILMSEMNGNHLCEQLKTSPTTKDIPVIFISALDELFDKAKAFSLGGVDYITQPFQVEEVLARVETQLHIRRLSQQLVEQNARLCTEIEERKKVENELQESRKLLQAMAEANPHIFYIYDLIEHRNVYASHEIYTTLGYTVEEVQQMGADVLSTLMHPDDFVRVSGHLNRFETANDGDVFESEYRMRHKNGKWHWLYTRETLFARRTDGKPWKILGTGTDITQRKRAEVELSTSEERFRSIFNNVSIGIALIDLDGYVLTANEAHCRLLGYSSDEFVGRHCLEFTHPDDRVLDKGLFLSLLGGERNSYAIDKRYIRKNGAIVWGRITVSLIKNEEGSPQHTTVVFEDISDKKQAELELKTAQTALERQLQRILLQERITYEIRSTLNPEQFLQTAATQIGQAFNVDRCLVHLYVESPTPRIPLVAQYRRPGIEPPWSLEIPVTGNPHAELMLSQDSVIACDDVDQEPLLEAALPICHEMGLKSMLGVRTSYQGKPNGAIGVHQYHHSRHWSEDEISLLETVAAQLGIAIAQANFLEHERQQRIKLDLQNQQLQQEIRVRQLAEAALKKSEERWQLVLKGNNEGIWDLNLVTNQVFRSARYKEIMGYEEDELGDDNDDWVSRIHPDDFERVMQANKDYFDRKVPHYAVEYRLRCKDGTYKWVLGRAQAVWDNTGKPVRMVGSTTDISDAYRQATQRKLAEAALIESEKKYRVLVETSQDIIWSLDAEGNYTFVNAAVKQIYGYDPSEMIGRSFTDFLPPEQIAQGIAILQRLFKGISVFQYEISHRGKDGKPVEVMFNAIAQQDDQGNVVGITGTASDITQRKIAEEKLKKSEANLAAAQRVAHVGSWEFNILTGETTWSEEKYRMFGLDASQRAPSYSQLIKMIHPDERAVFEQVVSCAIAEGTPYNIQFRILRPDGQFRHIETRAETICNETGQVIQLFGTVMDITERKQSEEALRQSEARYRAKAQELEHTLKQLKRTQSQLIQAEKMSSLGQMVAGIAHEINNPVSFIYGNISPATGYVQDLLELIRLYRQHYPEPVAEISAQIKAIQLDFIAEDFPKLLASMKEGANRITQIVISLRNFSRLDEKECKQVDIHQGIDNTLIILRHRLKAVGNADGIEVMKNYGQLPLVTCYASQLNQVFMNLLNNAVDALQGQPSPVITISTSLSQKSKVKSQKKDSLSCQSPLPNPQSIIIRIADNGFGMNEDVRQKIFDPFFTTKPVGSGTGLGLSISYQIVVEKHKGQLRCISAPGEGTEFVIELPLG